LEKDNPSLAISYNNMAMIYYAMRKSEEALFYAQKDIQISEKKLDKDHPSLGTSYFNMALIYELRSDYDNTTCYIDKAIEIESTKLNKDHPFLLKSLELKNNIEKI
jgi:tetratricopeptide (TPR) repeat protein